MVPTLLYILAGVKKLLGRTDRVRQRRQEVPTGCLRIAHPPSFFTIIPVETTHFPVSGFVTLTG